VFSVDADPDVLVLAAFLNPQPIPDYIRLCVDHRQDHCFCFQWGQNGTAIQVPAQILRKVLRTLGPGGRWAYNATPVQLELCLFSGDGNAGFLRVQIASAGVEVCRYLSAADTREFFSWVLR